MSSYDAAVVGTAMLEHPDLIRLSRGIRLLYLEALVWSKLHRTDGEVPKHMLRRMSDEPDIEVAADALVTSGRWADAGEAWSIVGYLDSQMSAARVARRQETARIRFDRWSAGSNDDANDVAGDVANDAASPAPPRPAKGGWGKAGGRGRTRAEPAAPAAVEEAVDDDEQFRCSRCRGLFFWPEIDATAPRRPIGGVADDSEAFCEGCAGFINLRDRSHQPICVAFTKGGEQCAQKVKADPEWPDPFFCQYHDVPRKRGAKP